MRRVMTFGRAAPVAFRPHMQTLGAHTSPSQIGHLDHCHRRFSRPSPAHSRLPHIARRPRNAGSFLGVCAQGAWSGFDDVACGFWIADGRPLTFSAAWLYRNFNLHHMVFTNCLSIDSTFLSSLSSAHLNKPLKKGGWFAHGWLISVKVTCLP
jgi:hypothetical protein